MIRTITWIIVITIVAFLGYWGYIMSSFANGVVEDTQRLYNFSLNRAVRNGDIIFQTSKSNQSKAIQIATKSKYSHVGIIYKNGDNLFVYEAIQPVKLTPLVDWIKRGENSKFVIKRLKNSKQVLTPEALKKMKTIGDRFKGKNYDLYFEWSDDRIYCSELVWKIYKEATGIEIGKTEHLSDFDLTSKAVKQKMKERYGEKIPLNEKVISPAAILNSDKLETVEIHWYH